jgi:glycerol-3-phosphate acyltransferase PlsY
LVAIVSYCLGSINSAILLSKKLYGYDVRDYGSGNAGMTNMFRSFGKKAGFLTLGGDAAKALVSVVLGFLFIGAPGQYIAGFFCMLGHSFPLYFRFKGGKGVIVSAITILLIDPLIFLSLVVIFALMFAATQIISASSITAAFFYPMVVYAFNLKRPSPIYIVFSFCIAFFVVAMHKENIHRLLNRTEQKFTLKKKDPSEKKDKNK